MRVGSFTFVLHSHIPWVLHHGRWPHGVDWLSEAAAESYLPLWRALHARADRGHPLGVTIDFSPVLCEQLAHPDFHREFITYLGQKLDAAAADRATFARTGEDEMAALASGWEQFYRATLEDFMGPHGPNLVARFRRLEEQGAIELFGCAATHAYLPLLSSDRAVEGQIRAGVAAHRRHFGRDPRGMWLPECAYRPGGPWTPPDASDAEPVWRAGLEEFLAAHGIRYFFVDAHLIRGGRPIGVYATRFDSIRQLIAPPGDVPEHRERLPYRAYRVGASARVSCFGRDQATAMQVWSGEHGYPGDPAYLDFHKKRDPGGLRYWAVTHPHADLADKLRYDPAAAAPRVREHARHFTRLLEGVLIEAGRRQSAPPVITAMFDTELFGHWWFEGPQFVAEVIDRLADANLTAVRASEALDRSPTNEVVALPEGSWGDGGGHAVWLNDKTRWTWPPLAAAQAAYETLAGRAARVAGDPLLERLLNQTGRELLLLQSSDWQFLITTQSAADYAEARFKGHLDAFERLADLALRRVDGGALAEREVQLLADAETRDSVFPDFEWRSYAAAPGEPVLLTP